MLTSHGSKGCAILVRDGGPVREDTIAAMTPFWYEPFGEHSQNWLTNYGYKRWFERERVDVAAMNENLRKACSPHMDCSKTSLSPSNASINAA